MIGIITSIPSKAPPGGRDGRDPLPAPCTEHVDRFQVPFWGREEPVVCWWLASPPANLYPNWLVVSNMFYPFHIWDVILPIDELHHFSRWWNSTTKQLILETCSFPGDPNLRKVFPPVMGCMGITWLQVWSTIVILTHLLHRIAVNSCKFRYSTSDDVVCKYSVNMPYVVHMCGTCG